MLHISLVSICSFYCVRWFHELICILFTAREKKLSHSYRQPTNADDDSDEKKKYNNVIQCKLIYYWPALMFYASFSPDVHNVATLHELPTFTVRAIRQHLCTILIHSICFSAISSRKKEKNNIVELFFCFESMVFNGAVKVSFKMHTSLSRKSE